MNNVFSTPKSRLKIDIWNGNNIRISLTMHRELHTHLIIGYTKFKENQCKFGSAIKVIATRCLQIVCLASYASLTRIKPQEMMLFTNTLMMSIKWLRVMTGALIPALVILTAH